MSANKQKMKKVSNPDKLEKMFDGLDDAAPDGGEPSGESKDEEMRERYGIPVKFEIEIKSLLLKLS